MTEEKIKWSHSKIDTFIRCPEAYRWKYIEKIKPKTKSPALALGSCMAAGVAAFRGGFKTNEIDLPAGSFDTAAAAFVYTWDKEGRILTEDREEDPLRSLPRGLEILQAYTERYPDEPERIIQPEIRFDEEVYPGLWFRGRLDGVIRDNIGAAIIEDKTMTRLGPAYFQEKRNGYQIRWYLLVAKKLGLFELFENKSPRAIINAIYIHKKELRFEREPVLKMTKEIDQAGQELQDWVSHIQATVERGVFPKSDYNECSKYGGCDYLPLKNTFGETRKRILASMYEPTESMPKETPQ